MKWIVPWVASSVLFFGAVGGGKEVPEPQEFSSSDKYDSCIDDHLSALQVQTEIARGITMERHGKAESTMADDIDVTSLLEDAAVAVVVTPSRRHKAWAVQFWILSIVVAVVLFANACICCGGMRRPVPTNSIKSNISMMKMLRLICMKRKVRCSSGQNVLPQGSPPVFTTPRPMNLGTSFAIPVTAIRDCVDDRLGFDIFASARLKVPVDIHATLKRAGGAWAKIEVSSIGSNRLLTPILSCFLAEGGDDNVASWSIQGALMSWQSLLFEEKQRSVDDEDDSGCEAEKRALEDDASAESCAQAMVELNVLSNRTDLSMPTDGENFDSIATPRGLSPLEWRNGPRRCKGLPLLELRDGLGRCSGQLKPSKQGHYELWQHETCIFSIEIVPDGCIIASPCGKEHAVATWVLGPRGLRVGREQGRCDTGFALQEFLQVDVDCGRRDAQEPALLVLCVLAVVTFGTPCERTSSDSIKRDSI